MVYVDFITLNKRGMTDILSTLCYSIVVTLMLAVGYGYAVNLLFFLFNIYQNRIRMKMGNLST